jgi:hypothetical protein
MEFVVAADDGDRSKPTFFGAWRRVAARGDAPKTFTWCVTHRRRTSAELLARAQRRARAKSSGRDDVATTPSMQHRLYFFPDPHRHGAFRGMRPACGTTDLRG